MRRDVGSRPHGPGYRSGRQILPASALRENQILSSSRLRLRRSHHGPAILFGHTSSLTDGARISDGAILKRLPKSRAAQDLRDVAKKRDSRRGAEARREVRRGGGCRPRRSRRIWPAGLPCLRAPPEPCSFVFATAPEAESRWSGQGRAEGAIARLTVGRFGERRYSSTILRMVFLLEEGFSMVHPGGSRILKEVRAQTRGSSCPPVSGLPRSIRGRAAAIAFLSPRLHASA